jgi:hypothetical protein
MKKTIAAALLAFALLPAFAQSVSYTPTSREAKQARDNTKRDAKLADDMEKARLKEEAKKPAVLILPEQKKEEASKPMKQPATFMAAVPGEKKKAKKKAD